MNNLIILAGIPGSGKSTLARILEKKGYLTQIENHTLNAYHSDFVKNKKRWAFHNEIDFLTTSAEFHKNASKTKINSCQDGSIYQSFNVYIRYLFESKAIDKRDFGMLERVYEFYSSSLPAPKKTIILQATPSECAKRIDIRARKLDKKLNTDISFLVNMDKLLSKWISNWNNDILFVDTSKINFLEDEEIVDEILKNN